MKRGFLIGLFTAALILGGCSSKDVATDEKADENVEQVTQTQNTSTDGGEASEVDTEEVSSESQEVAVTNSTDNTENSINALEAKLESIYFDFDKFNIRDDMHSKVENDAKVIKSTDLEFKVKLEGNCDEWGSDEYNFALGLKRAKAVKNALVAEGVSEDKITLVSYGESNPVCSDHTKECWEKNRRVDLKIIP